MGKVIQFPLQKCLSRSKKQMPDRSEVQFKKLNDIRDQYFSGGINYDEMFDQICDWITNLDRGTANEN